MYFAADIKSQIQTKLLNLLPKSKNEILMYKEGFINSQNKSLKNHELNFNSYMLLIVLKIL